MTVGSSLLTYGLPATLSLHSSVKPPVIKCPPGEGYWPAELQPIDSDRVIGDEHDFAAWGPGKVWLCVLANAAVLRRLSLSVSDPFLLFSTRSSL
jgi:hypothetical protein